MKRILIPMVALTLALFVSSCSPTNTSPTSSTSGVDYRKSRADVVVLSFFDMYCPQCQRDAKYVNEIHATTLRHRQGSKINFYAIGWNNTPLESEMYRKRFNVTYPVVPDKSRAISHRFEKIKPPLLIVLKKQGGQWIETDRIKKIRGNSADILSRIQP